MKNGPSSRKRLERIFPAVETEILDDAFSEADGRLISASRLVHKALELSAAAATDSQAKSAINSVCEKIAITRVPSMQANVPSLSLPIPTRLEQAPPFETASSPSQMEPRPEVQSPNLL